MLMLFCGLFTCLIPETRRRPDWDRNVYPPTLVWEDFKPNETFTTLNKVKRKKENIFSNVKIQPCKQKLFHGPGYRTHWPSSPLSCRSPLSCWSATLTPDQACHKWRACVSGFPRSEAPWSSPPVHSSCTHISTWEEGANTGLNK